MKSFTYFTPQTLDEAVGLLDQHHPDAKIIAGGQSLLLDMKDRAAKPDFLVSLADLPNMRNWWHTESGELVIGAAATYASLARASFPGWQAEISSVASNLADRSVRNIGTIGGALCQGGPRFDAPALAVGLDATVQALSGTGTRTLPAAELFRPSGGTVLDPGEILTTITFPRLAAFTGVAFEKFRVRLFDSALASAVCGLRLEKDGRAADVRIVLGAVAPAPIVAQNISCQLTGRIPGDDNISEISKALMDEVPVEPATTSPSRRYQRELVGVVARRAITRALEQARR